ncbi:outer membrane beta-barrel protein [Larkinella punicea]|nr:outer membrane beta-barrel protein [Larkinella punicea]
MAQWSTKTVTALFGMKLIGVACLVFLVVIKAQAQGGMELGIRGGGTFTHGYTVIPAQTLSPGLELPRIRNSNNGIGIGYFGSLWVRKHYDRFFLQAEISYSSLVLKQKAPIERIDVAAAKEFGVNLPNIQPGTLYARLNTTTEPTLTSLNIPLFIGKRGHEGKWRVYGGPTFLFTIKAEAARTASGQVEASASLPSFTLSEISDQVDLTNADQAGILQVKTFNFGAEFGAGVTLLKRLEVDVRYGLPVGGVFNDSGITGFIGYATLTLGYKLAHF